MVNVNVTVHCCPLLWVSCNVHHLTSPAGIISREQAEALLKEGGPGLFLVRVSERIFGYVLSYRSKEGVKHLLIDASENCYMLLGDQIRFTSLSELVEYHQVMYCARHLG